MLAYPVAEAEEMLREKLAAAERSLSNCEEDLEFLREQVTVCSLPLLCECSLVWIADYVDTGGCYRAGV